jgi:DNA polymerase-3 subunit gamma/tau
LIYPFRVFWLVLAALGDALTAILGCAGLLAGVWFMARGSRAGGDLSIAPSAAPPTAAAVPVAEPADTPDPTAFRHGAIRLVGEPPTAPAAPAPAVGAVPPAPALAVVPPAPELAVEPEPVPEPEPEPPPPPPPAYLPPPIPRAPRTSFRQGPIRLGGIEHGRTTRGPSDDSPDAA